MTTTRYAASGAIVTKRAAITGGRMVERSVCCAECIDAAISDGADADIAATICQIAGAEIADHACDREYGDDCCCACGEIA